MFNGHAELLKSHRGWDPGTRQLGQSWSAELGCRLHLALNSRLLGDLNRSEHHRLLFSEITRGLSRQQKQHILAEYYHPHRQAIAAEVRQAIDGGHRVLHLGLHSFTPQLGDVVRNADVGLLYDPARGWEHRLCGQWKKAMEVARPATRVRLNYPYRGVADGLTTALRRTYREDRYAGIELEVNQQIVFDGGRRWHQLGRLLLETMRQVASV